MISKKQQTEFAREVGHHLFDAYLPFWCGPALDRQHGGWMGWLANDLKPDRTQPKGLIVNARILWAFSAAYRARPLPVYREMAERALDFLEAKFWDPVHGGAFWRLNDAGHVLDDSKKCYGQAFVIYALAECHRAFGNPGALDRAREAFEYLEHYAHDGACGGYFEVRNRDWSEAGGDARLSDKDLNEKKSMNNHLHVLEAYTNLHRVWRHPRVVARLRELVDLFLNRILDPRTLHLHHFFDEQWEVRSNSYTFGHDIEASWLLCEAADELGEADRIRQVRAAAVRMAEVCFNEGLGADGALGYEGRDGRIIDPGHEWWPQAEAIVGFLNAHELSGDGKYLAAAMRIWNYITNNLVDPVHGEWFWRIQPDGRPDPKLPKVSEWKGPYHVTRACLETLRRLQQLPELKA